MESVIRRFSSGAIGRNKASAFGDLVWVVSNARTKDLGFRQQVEEMFALADETLQQAGSNKQHLISVHVYLSDMEDKAAFDSLWNTWIGDDPQHWPQRVCIGAVLAPGLLAEMQLVACTVN